MPRIAIAPRWRKVLRDAWLHKARTLLVVLAISVGIVGAGAVLDTWSLLRQATRGEFAASNPASATLRADSIDAELVARVRALPSVRDAQVRYMAMGTVRLPEGERPAIVYAFTDLEAIRIGVVKPEIGAWPPRDGEIVVEASSIPFSGTSVGDALSLRLGREDPSSLPVVGIARDVGLAPGWMEHVVYAFATRATLERLAGPVAAELQLVVADRMLDREGVRAAASEVRAVIEKTGRKVSSVEVPVPGRHIHAAQIESLLMTQAAFGLLALLLSGILVVNLIAAMLAGQVREIGILKTLGGTSAQIGAMYLMLAFVLGLAACAIAIPAAALAGRAYATFTATLLNFDVTGVSIPTSILLAQLCVGALLPVAAACIPVLQGCRISVHDALHEPRIRAVGALARRKPWSRAGGSTTLVLSIRNAFRRRQRMILTLVTLAMGGAVHIAALDLRAAIRGSVDLLFSANRFDVALRLARTLPPGQVEPIVANVEGVAFAECWGTVRAALVEEDGKLGNTLAISAPPAGSRMFQPVLRAGRLPVAADGNALVVNRRLLDEEPRLAAGRLVTLSIDGRTAPWRIVGVADTGPMPVAYTLRETLARVTENPGVDRVVIAGTVGTASTRLDLVERLRAELRAHDIELHSSQLMDEGRRAMEDHLLLVASFLGAMALLMIVVGGLGLGSTMSLAVLERTREIGVLRAIGAPHRTIVAMVQIEGLAVALLSFALALPLSMPMSLVLGWAFGRVMFPVPVLWLPQLAAVLQWLAVVVVVSFLACAWPARRATRVPTSAALAYE